MKAFEIWYWQPPQWPEPHPCVVISHPDRADRKTPVEVVAYSTQRAARAAKATEFILDEADGRDWPALCKCDLIYAAPKAELKNRKGIVSETRRAPLIRKIISAHGWGEVLAS